MTDRIKPHTAADCQGFRAQLGSLYAQVTEATTSYNELRTAVCDPWAFEYGVQPPTDKNIERAAYALEDAHRLVHEHKDAMRALGFGACVNAAAEHSDAPTTD